MAKDISNAYLITTADGDVMVNTGFMDNAERTRKLLAPHRSGPLRKIVLTQAHADHYGGVPVLAEPGRSEERRVGEERDSRCQSRWPTYRKKTKKPITNTMTKVQLLK